MAHGVADNPKQRHPNRSLAVLAMFTAALLFAGMVILAKAAGKPLAGRPIPSAEIAVARWVFGLLAIIPLHGRWGIDLLGKDRRGLLMRGIYGGVAVYTYFFAIENTSISHAVFLNYTSLIFAPLFAFFMLKERVSRGTIGAIGVAALGIYLVTAGNEGVSHLSGDLAGLASGALAGAALTEVRRLRQGESAWSIFFYLSLVGLPIALIACLFRHPVMPTSMGWVLLIGMAACSIGAQLLMTYGYKYVRSAEGGVMGLSQVVYTTMAGWLLFAEPVSPSAMAGGALIFTAALWISFRG